MSKEKQIAELGKKTRENFALQLVDDGNKENISEHIEVIIIEEEAHSENLSDCKL